MGRPFYPQAFFFSVNLGRRATKAVGRGKRGKTVRFFPARCHDTEVKKPVKGRCAPAAKRFHVIALPPPRAPLPTHTTSAKLRS